MKKHLALAEILPGIHRLTWHWQELAFASVMEIANRKWNEGLATEARGQERGKTASYLRATLILFHQKGLQHWLSRLRHQAKHNVTVCHPPSIPDPHQ